MKIKTYHKDFDYTYTLGVFETIELLENKPELVMRVYLKSNSYRNMGTIIRTMLGFNYTNLAIIRPGVDVFDPRVIRASMGALFNINFEYFNSFDEYLTKYPEREVYPLMLKGAKNIHQITAANNKHSLVFGNESSGLPDDYLKYGQSVFIPHSDKIDSLNLSMALGITLCHFSMMEFKDKQVLR